MMELNHYTISISSLRSSRCYVVGCVCTEMLHQCFEWDRLLSIRNEIPENLSTLRISYKLQYLVK